MKLIIIILLLCVIESFITCKLEAGVGTVTA
jgi:hypothetical protein